MQPFAGKSVLLPVYGEAQKSGNSGQQNLTRSAVGNKAGLQSFKLPETEAPGELDHLAQLSIDAPAGHSFTVCPFFPFVVENCVAIVVDDVKMSGSNSGYIEIAGTWRRSHWRSVGDSDATGVSVKLTLRTDAAVPGHNGPPTASQKLCVASAQGSGSLLRCAAENWLAIVGDGVPLHLSAVAQLRPGSTLLLQRPQARVYVLRSPEEQLSRLLMQLTSQRGGQLLAAPASGGVAVMAACKCSSGMLLEAEVLAEIEQRFSVVFLPERAADNIPATKATDAILRRLIAFGVRHSLRKDMWQSAEFPYRLFQSQSVSSTEVLQRPSLRVPSVDVVCDKASTASSQIIAELRISAAVRLVQPLAPFLARAGCSPEATKRPPVHVLPRLTAAQVTHIWQDGQMPKEQLPQELREANAFSDYWRLIHGHVLNESSLTSFARVEFLGMDRSYERGLVLTYPVSCLWRTFWTCQPALSKQHGVAIFKQVLHSLDQNAAFGTWHLRCNSSNWTAAAAVPPMKTALKYSRERSQDATATMAKKVEEPERESTASAQIVPRIGRTGKRRLILPLLQHASSTGTVESGLPSKRRRAG